MNTTNQVLDRIQSEFGLPSDYAISKVLGITRAAVSRYRNKGQQFDDSIAYRAAKLLELDPADLLASLHTERAANDDESSAWDSIRKKCELAKQVKKQTVIDALEAASKGETSTAQRKILAELTQQCILCKIGIISENSTFSPIYQNIPKKHLN